MKTIEIFFNDLSEERQKDVIETFGFYNGNWDIMPLAVIEVDDEIDDTEEEEEAEGTTYECHYTGHCANHCPLGGDTENDCADCAYSVDYHFVEGECLRREK